MNLQDLYRLQDSLKKAEQKIAELLGIAKSFLKRENNLNDVENRQKSLNNITGEGKNYQVLTYKNNNAIWSSLPFKPFQYTKLTDFTYRIYCGTLDYDYAYNWFRNNSVKENGSCSSIRKGNLYGRNYDWTYSNNIDWIVETPSVLGRYATIGFGGIISELTQEFVDSGEYSEMYNLIPFRIVDGINEKGVVVNTNVVPESDIKTTGTIPEEDLRETICSRMLPRFILDKFASAADAVDYIVKHVSVYNHGELSNEHNYDIHIMIADATDTYIMEFVNNEIIVHDDKYFMTNFALANVVFNNDGSVYTPYTQTSTNDAVKTNHIHEYGAGLERFNIINSEYDNIDSTNDMESVLNAIKYSNAYTKTNDSEKWYTEGVGKIKGYSLDIKCNSPLDKCERRYNEMKYAYDNRSRETELTWHTIHSCIYDISELSVSVKFQENNTSYQFSLSAGEVTIETIDEKIQSHNSSSSSHSDIRTEVSLVKDIAEGANIAIVFDSYSELVTFFNTESDSLKVGTNLYIKTLEVPDLWISSVESSSVSYTYTTDSDFLTYINNNGQIGYYKFSELETQKVDLSNYATLTDLGGKVSKSGDTMSGELTFDTITKGIIMKSNDNTKAFRIASTGNYFSIDLVQNYNTDTPKYLRVFGFSTSSLIAEISNGLYLGSRAAENKAAKISDIDNKLADYLQLSGGTLTGDLKFVSQEEISIEFEAGNAVKWRIWKPTTSDSIYFQIKSGNSWVNRMQISSTGEGRFKGPLFNNDQITNPLVNSEEVKSICLPLAGGEITGDVTFQGQPNTHQYIKFFKNDTSLHCFAIRNPYVGGQIDIGRFVRSTGAYNEFIRIGYAQSKGYVGILSDELYVGQPLIIENKAQKYSDIYKQGIVSQTQTWSGSDTTGYSYTMSNQVTGNIPISFIELVEELGAVFNETSGYFEINGLTDVSYNEMKKIYTMSGANISSNTWIGMFRTSPLRTNIFNYPTGTSFGNCTMSNMFAYSDIEVANIIPLTQLSEWTTDDIDGANAFLRYIGTSNYIYPATTSSGNVFRNSERLKHIRGIIRYAESSTNFKNVFDYCYSLETVWLYLHNHNTNFSWSPKLKLDTIQFIVNQRSTISTASAFTITLHPTTYATCQADTTEYTYSGNTYVGIIAYANARNITIQSA